jgi:KipI family sensor histidine kinase inhibitor
MSKEFEIKMAGDCAVSVVFGDEISESVNNRVSSLRKIIESDAFEGITGCIPTYRALLIRYSPAKLRHKDLVAYLEDCAHRMGKDTASSAMVYVVPVYYGDDYGPDLENVMKVNGLTQADVIDIHTSADYRIYMLGFTPGFPYLGGMDERIATPRLKQPRTKISAGSVGIAGSQTGIYPIDSPGGWQIIGRTPLKLFDMNSASPFLLEAGNYIRFKAVDLKTYESIEKAVADNTYKVEMLPYAGEVSE